MLYISLLLHRILILSNIDMSFRGLLERGQKTALNVASTDEGIGRWEREYYILYANTLSSI